MAAAVLFLEISGEHGRALRGFEVCENLLGAAWHSAVPFEEEAHGPGRRAVVDKKRLLAVEPHIGGRKGRQLGVYLLEQVIPLGQLALGGDDVVRPPAVCPAGPVEVFRAVCQGGIGLKAQHFNRHPGHVLFVVHLQDDPHVLAVFPAPARNGLIGLKSPVNAPGVHVVVV